MQHKTAFSRQCLHAHACAASSAHCQVSHGRVRGIRASSGKGAGGAHQRTAGVVVVVVVVCVCVCVGWGVLHSAGRYVGIDLQRHLAAQEAIMTLCRPYDLV